MTNNPAADLLADKAAIDDRIAQLASQWQKQFSAKYGASYADIFAAYLSVLARGGKRIRGALTVLAYDIFGGCDRNAAVDAAVVIEMLHASLLVIDDIADNSDTRRGQPAAHRLLEKYHAEHNLHGDALHFGK